MNQYDATFKAVDHMFDETEAKQELKPLTSLENLYLGGLTADNDFEVIINKCINKYRSLIINRSLNI